MNEEALILVVENEDLDAALLQDAFHRAGVLNPLKILLNADEAIDYLSGTGPFYNRQDFPVPGLIFVDLQEPGTGELEIVRWAKSHRTFSEIPVIVMTHTEDEVTLKEVYDAGANIAFCKPAESEKFVEAIRLCCEHLLVS